MSTSTQPTQYSTRPSLKLAQWFEIITCISLLFATVATTGCQRGATQPKNTPTQTKESNTVSTSPKILIVLTSHAKLGDTGKTTGFYLSEVSHPMEVFEKAGYTVEFVSVKGGAAPMDGIKRDDPINVKFLKNETMMKRINNTKSVQNVDPSSYDAIFFAGGHGTMWDFPNNARLQKITAQMYENGKVVAAVCHGPASLVNVKLSTGKHLVDGKRVTGFTNEEESAAGLTEVVPFLLETTFKARGATFKGAPKFTKNVVVDERLVTGQNPQSATGVAQEIVKLLSNK